MASSWDQVGRERAYTALCEAVTAAGRENESLFLARLVLLLTERLADEAIVAEALAEASRFADTNDEHEAARDPDRGGSDRKGEAA